jgi:hypothetical protein
MITKLNLGGHFILIPFVFVLMILLQQCGISYSLREVRGEAQIKCKRQSSQLVTCSEFRIKEDRLIEERSIKAHSVEISGIGHPRLTPLKYLVVIYEQEKYNSNNFAIYASTEEEASVLKKNIESFLADPTRDEFVVWDSLP